jgi:predicted negative regulator of RcsB-dependent stress response
MSYLEREDYDTGNEDGDEPMKNPWLDLMILFSILGLIAAFAFTAWAGHSDMRQAQNQAVYDRAVKAHLDHMKKPLKYSLPEHFLEMVGE